MAISFLARFSDVMAWFGLFWLRPGIPSCNPYPLGGVRVTMGQGKGSCNFFKKKTGCRLWVLFIGLVLLSSRQGWNLGHVTSALKVQSGPGPGPFFGWTEDQSSPRNSQNQKTADRDCQNCKKPVQTGLCYDFKWLRQLSTVVGSKVQVLMSLEECKS